MSTKKGDPRLSRKYREVRLRVLAAGGYVCYYCGHEGQDGNNLTIDHIIPVSKAPELAIDETNMRIACKSCNSRKGSRNERVFLDSMRTPPVFSAFPSPTQSVIHQDSPFTARPVGN